MDANALSTRDENLPAAYSAGLERLSLAPLWAALHQLLPQERVSRVVPHRWRWAELRPQLLDAGRLVPMEQAERRVLVLCNPGLPGALSRHRDPVRGPPDHPARRDGAQPSPHAGRAAPGRRGARRLHHGGGRALRDGAGRSHHHAAHALARSRPRGRGARDLAGRPRHPAGAGLRGLVGLQDAPGAAARRRPPTPRRTSSPRPGWCRAARAIRRRATRRCAGPGARCARRSRAWRPPRRASRR